MRGTWAGEVSPWEVGRKGESRVWTLGSHIFRLAATRSTITLAHAHHIHLSIIPISRKKVTTISQKKSYLTVYRAFPPNSSFHQLWWPAHTNTLSSSRSCPLALSIRPSHSSSSITAPFSATPAFSTAPLLPSAP